MVTIRHLAGDAIEVPVELNEPVGRRLDELHQFLPRGVIGRLAVQRVEQKRRLRLRSVRGSGENDESERKA